MKISIILPMYNEDEIINITLTSIDNYMKSLSYDYEIIVIDDDSTDKSYYDVVNYMTRNKNVKLFSNKQNRGKGYSVRRGLELSTGDYMLVTDCDMSTSISEIEKLLRYKNEYDLVVGSRYLRTSTVKRKQSLLRIIYSRTYNEIINLLFNLKIKDTQCGFKLYSKRLRNLIVNQSRIDRYSFDVEHFVICKENKKKYKEVGIIWIDRKPQGFTKHIKSMFLDLLRIKKNQKIGEYYNYY